MLFFLARVRCFSALKNSAFSAFWMLHGAFFCFLVLFSAFFCFLVPFFCLMLPYISTKYRQSGQ